MSHLINWFVTACHVCFCSRDRTSLTKTNDEKGELVSNRTDSCDRVVSSGCEIVTEGVCVWALLRCKCAYIYVSWWGSESVCVCVCCLVHSTISCQRNSLEGHESCWTWGAWLICVVTLWELLMHADELCLNSLHSQETVYLLFLILCHHRQRGEGKEKKVSGDVEELIMGIWDNNVYDY